jgi:hypothetical protein
MNNRVGAPIIFIIWTYLSPNKKWRKHQGLAQRKGPRRDGFIELSSKIVGISLNLIFVRDIGVVLDYDSNYRVLVIV